VVNELGKKTKDTEFFSGLPSSFDAFEDRGAERVFAYPIIFGW
jgi:hypothetical protein